MSARIPRPRRHGQAPAKRALRRGLAGHPALENLEDRRLLTGTWTEVTNPLPHGDTAQTMLLLSNGDVLVNGGNEGAETGNNAAAEAWYELIPDSKGSYANGTWKTLASSSVGRLFYASDVLPNGDVFVMGGEYSTQGDDSNTGQIYDPSTNTWKTIAPFPESTAGDDVSEVLPNGTVMVGSNNDGNTYIYNPTTNVWSAGPSDINGDSFGEEGWAKLWDGSTLDYQIEGSTAQQAVRMVPGATTAQDQWVNAGIVPVQLDDDGGNTDLVPELGPGFMLPDGQAYWIGASDQTALYTLPTASNPSGTWTAGPVQTDVNGGSVGGYDAPGAVEANGDVLWAAGPNDGSYSGPTTILEYDPTTNQISHVVAPGPDLSDSEFVGRMLDVPSGQVLYTNGDQSNLWLYNPDSAPDPDWAPTVSSVAFNGSSYTLTGTQLNGLDEGAAYGDDAQMASNYPIIKLTDAEGNVSFATTSNWSSEWVGPGSTPETVQFTLPASATQGSYTLNVIANGISSTNYTFNTHPLSLVATPPSGAVEATPFSAQVATFSDTQDSDPSDYTATIAWGDGTTSQGLVETVGSSIVGGTTDYEVLASHTYASGGDYSMTVSVANSDDGESDTDTTTVSVAALPLVATSVPLAFNEGALYSGNLLSFVDTTPNPTDASDYTATINWGDGTTTEGIVNADPSGAFNDYDVAASHVYGAGNYDVQVSLSSVNDASLTTVIPVTVYDLPLTAVAVPVAVQEGAIFNGLVATFTDPDPRNPPLTNYSATIDWGNGTTQAGTIVANPTGPGYAVQADEYFSAGDYTATITIHDLGGASVVVTTTVTVPDAPLSGSGAKFTAEEGVANAVQVATFVDADPVPHTGSFYTVSVNWGDGTSSAGSVIPDGQGGYLVYASHAYAAGTYTYAVTISDNGGANATGGEAKTTLKGTATITPAPLVAAPIAISASAGSTFFGAVASFTTTATNLTASSFTAEIAWGDGSTSAGTIKVNPKGGFEVVGANTYADPGFFPVAITISSKSGSVTSTTAEATVAAAPITAGALPISGNERSTVGGVLAEFTTADPALGVSNFVATIDWGDGETTMATIAAVSGGGFSVSGDHVYGLSGTYPVTVTIASTDGAGTTATTSATIAFVPSPIVGGLVASSFSRSTAANITNQTLPTFSGQAIPGSTVTVLAQIVGTAGYAAIGTAPVGADGTWTVQSTQVLPTGEYNIYAQATDAGGVAGPVQALLPSTTSGPLIVDTQSAKVTSLALQSSQFQVGLAAGISGLNQATVMNPANYSVEYVSSTGAVTPIAVTGVSVASGNSATGEVVDVQFGGGKKLKSGGYVMTIQSSGIEDNAGNTLTESYYVPYPSAYNTPGNDYQAEIVTNGKTTGSPQQFVPPSAAAGAKAHETFIKAHLRIQRALRKR